MRTGSVVMLLATLLAACSKPQPPEKERPPEPQAEAHSGSRDAIHAPLEQARAVETEVQHAADAQRAAIEAAGG